MILQCSSQFSCCDVILVSANPQAHNTIATKCYHLNQAQIGPERNMQRMIAPCMMREFSRLNSAFLSIILLFFSPPSQIKVETRLSTFLFFSFPPILLDASLCYCLICFPSNPIVPSRQSTSIFQSPIKLLFPAV